MWVLSLDEREVRQHDEEYGDLREPMLDQFVSYFVERIVQQEKFGNGTIGKTSNPAA